MTGTPRPTPAHLQRGGARALAVARLQHEQHAVLHRELAVLHGERGLGRSLEVRESGGDGEGPAGHSSLQGMPLQGVQQVVPCGQRLRRPSSEDMYTPACRACASPAAWCWPPGRRRPGGSCRPSAGQAGNGRYGTQRSKLPRQCSLPAASAQKHAVRSAPPMLTWDTSLGVRMPATTSSPCEGKRAGGQHKSGSAGWVGRSAAQVAPQNACQPHHRAVKTCS